MKTTKKRRWWVVGLGIIVILGVLYGAGFWLNGSRSKQLDTAITALNSNDPSRALDILSAEDYDLTLTATKVKPLLAYLQAHPDKIAQLKRAAAADEADEVIDGLEFERIGMKWGIFPRYGFKVEGIHPRLTTNGTTTQVTVNNTLLRGVTGTVRNHRIGPYVPGRYTFVAKETQGKETAQSRRVIDLVGSDDPHVDLTFPDTAADMAKQDAAGNTTSNAADTPTRDQAEDLIEDVFEGIEAVSNGDQDSDSQRLPDYFVDGTKNKAYQRLLDHAQQYMSNAHIGEIDIDTNVTTNPFTGQGGAGVQLPFTVRYSASDDDDTDASAQTYAYRATVELHNSQWQIKALTQPEQTSDTDD